MLKRFPVCGALVLPVGLAFGGAYEDALYLGCADRVSGSCETAVDCREVYPVTTWLDGETVVKGLNYSAIGWDLEPAGDPSRTVAITARSGTLANGVFTPDGSAEFEVMPANGGRGLFDWRLGDIAGGVYRLVHKVTEGGSDVDEAPLYGYFYIRKRASQSEAEAALIDSITHPIAVHQDEQWPWQPIDFAVKGTGLVTEPTIPQGVETETSFSVKGRGILHYEYGLTGGGLVVVADGNVIATHDDPTPGWVSCRIAFDGYGEHEVAFVYTAAGDGTEAGLRKVRWEILSESQRVADGLDNLCVDLTDGGVRSPERLSDVLPFVYSSTNWIGDVEGVSAASVARVTIVRLKETEGVDMKDWDEVPGTFKELKRSVGEGEITWNARKGVWRATFDILEGEDDIHQEAVLFDLRESRGPGMAIILY